MCITKEELEEMQEAQNQGLEPNEVVRTKERMDRILNDLFELFHQKDK
jgi:hypothetical protein